MQYRLPNMRNALLPSLPSHPYDGFENNEFQMQSIDLSAQMDSKVNHVHGITNGFCLEPKLSSDDIYPRIGGGFAIPYRPLISYQPACLEASTLSMSPQQSMMPGNKLPLAQFESTTKNARKRGLAEVNEARLQKGSTKRKINGTSSVGKIHHGVTEVPVRRSQKLGDKITTLQKLVSPYGKTDTASVLEEASLYIKLLHQQIQNMFHITASSYGSAHPQVGLRSRELCLVPLSFTHQVTEEDIFHHRLI